MMIDKHKKKLKAVKEYYPLLFPRVCKCCDNEFVREKMFCVEKVGVNGYLYYNSYCKSCTPTKEDVLHEEEKRMRRIAPPRL